MTEKQKEWFTSIIRNDIETVEKMIPYYDINDTYSFGYSGLHQSICNNLYGMCKLLIENGADVNQIDNYGDNILRTALYLNHLNINILKLLIDNNAILSKNTKISNVRNFGYYIVQEMIITKYPERISELIKNVDINPDIKKKYNYMITASGAGLL